MNLVMLKCSNDARTLEVNILEPKNTSCQNVIHLTAFKNLCHAKEVDKTFLWIW